MVKALKRRVKNEKGLTLVELLAVIVGIVSSIAIPSIGNIVEKSRAKALVMDAVGVMNAAQLYFLDTGNSGPVTLEVLKDHNYLETQGRLTSALVYYENGDLRIKAKGQNGNVTLDTVATGITYDDLVNAEVTVVDGQVQLKDKDGTIIFN